MCIKNFCFGNLFLLGIFVTEIYHINLLNYHHHGKQKDNTGRREKASQNKDA